MSSSLSEASDDSTICVDVIILFLSRVSLDLIAESSIKGYILSIVVEKTKKFSVVFIRS